MAETKAEIAQRREVYADQLRAWLPIGATIHTNIDHVSRSGMSRDVQVFAVVDGEIANITGYVAVVIGATRSPRDRWGIRVGGCGFDAGFDVVYQLGRALYPDGFGCIGRECPSNDHSNGDRDYTPHGTIKRGLPAPVEGWTAHFDTRGHYTGESDRYHWHTSGGYAYTHRSM